MEPTAKLLSDLVAIPSMNPMGRGRTGPQYCEEHVAQFVLEYLRASGIDAERDDVAPHRPNVVAHFDVGAPRTLMLEAHMDTVFADAMTVPPFEPLLKDGKIYGRGSCDTKGSLAVFLHVLRNLTQRPGRGRFNVLFLAVSDEEYRFTGAIHAAARGLKADAAIVGEPTCLHIVRAHKGVTRWRIETHGKAAHSAYPERGDNAIYTMTQILLRLEDHAADLRCQGGHPLLGTPSLSVGVIEGGQAVNIVPDTCRIEIDRRTLPGETTESVLAPVRRILAEVPHWSLEKPHLCVPGMEVAEDAPIVTLLGAAIREANMQVTVEAAHYATNAGVYNAAGIPSIVWGPGDIAQAHTEAEYIEVAQLTAAAQILESLIA